MRNGSNCKQDVGLIQMLYGEAEIGVDARRSSVGRNAFGGWTDARQLYSTITSSSFEVFICNEGAEGASLSATSSMPFEAT